MLRAISYVGVLLIALSGAAYAAATNPPGTVDLSVTLTENGKPDGKPVKDIFQREADDPRCDRCPTLTIAGAAAGMLRVWGDMDNAEFAAQGGKPDEAAVVGQKRAREKLAERIEANPHGVALSTAEASRLTKLLGRMLTGAALGQALTVVAPNEPVPDLK